LRLLELKRYKEKCRVLEDSLLVLAKQHHSLELSLSTGVDMEIGVHPSDSTTALAGTPDDVSEQRSSSRRRGNKNVVGYIDRQPSLSQASSFVDIPSIDRQSYVA
jgi:hypothetical protein